MFDNYTTVKHIHRQDDTEARESNKLQRQANNLSKESIERQDKILIDFDDSQIENIEKVREQFKKEQGDERFNNSIFGSNHIVDKMGYKYKRMLQTYLSDPSPYNRVTSELIDEIEKALLITREEYDIKLSALCVLELKEREVHCILQETPNFIRLLPKRGDMITQCKLSSEEIVKLNTYVRLVNSDKYESNTVFTYLK